MQTQFASCDASHDSDGLISSRAAQEHSIVTSIIMNNSKNECASVYDAHSVAKTEPSSDAESGIGRCKPHKRVMPCG